MDIDDAVLSSFTKYASLEGRAPRSEFWWFAVFNAGALTLLTVLAFLDLAFGLPFGGKIGGWHPATLAGLYWLAVLIPSFAVSVRRLHDTGQSGWWLLWWFLPVFGPLILLVTFIAPGTSGPNAYGPDPLDLEDREADNWGSTVPHIPRH